MVLNHQVGRHHVSSQSVPTGWICEHGLSDGFIREALLGSTLMVLIGLQLSSISVLVTNELAYLNSAAAFAAE